jgi:hypothetical protein
MSESQPTSPADDFINVFLTAFLGIGVVIVTQTCEDSMTPLQDDSGQ